LSHASCSRSRCSRWRGSPVLCHGYASWPRSARLASVGVSQHFLVGLRVVLFRRQGLRETSGTCGGGAQKGPLVTAASQPFQAPDRRRRRTAHLGRILRPLGARRWRPCHVFRASQAAGATCCESARGKALSMRGVATLPPHSSDRGALLLLPRPAICVEMERTLRPAVARLDVRGVNKRQRTDGSGDFCRVSRREDTDAREAQSPRPRRPPRTGSRSRNRRSGRGGRVG
jgi:hypothetical protein